MGAGNERRLEFCMTGPTMTDEEQVRTISGQLADAIRRRDSDAIRAMLAPGFVHRSHGGASVTADAFVAAIDAIPGEIVSLNLEELHTDRTPTGILVTGVQHAEVRVDAELIVDRRRFIDWFVAVAGEWRIQAAVDMPVGRE
jgi:hypothetical protein